MICLHKSFEGGQSVIRRSILVLILMATLVTSPWAGGATDTGTEEEELNVLVGHWTVGADDSPFEAAKREMEARYPNLTVVFDVQQGEAT